MTTFGDGISWDAEALRAAVDDPPGAGVSELHLNLREALADIERPSIVDCGCNIARFAPPLVGLGFDYTGLDQSDEALRISRIRYPTLRFEKTFLWDAWPERFAPFDAALCNAVLQHNALDEKLRILPRIAEAVRIGGVFVMAESTVREETKTQLRHDHWIDIVCEHGFKFCRAWHPNPEFGICDNYLFRRVG